jgi:beta-phosphoglucomutase-like phosphatase (HAD superfamily)
VQGDYLTYVDGNPRYDAVASFLSSRQITIPYGSPADPPSAETVCGLGNRKDNLFTQKALRGKPEPDIFLQCLSQLTSPADPLKAGIAEDAIAGVMAERRGWFGLVLGVDRKKSGALTRNGANWVIDDFREITADQVLSFFPNRARAA